MRMTREEMVRVIMESYQPVKDPLVLNAMRTVQRHEFVPNEYVSRAYEDTPLPIDCDQTISQPWIVAKMTELLKPSKGMVILEIGTGSGYQAAILAEIVDKVYTIERIPKLAENAERRLKKLGYNNVIVRIGDGSVGWPEMSPFDGIIVTAGAPDIPNSLKEQLKEGGRLVIPVGNLDIQELCFIVKEGDNFKIFKHSGCRFVPLIGIRGWREGG